ncbi:MupG family TIM beta-alpha barrel fold protein [Caldivirga maquilingensis]|uniref:DUF871 domain-containing protein n=1 Tax=Caldivirga maquilingensis (strain ATCC 700844 / DSM 13496 / JCM 10307 / IC-167) TaxID=397948 RepID=A8MAC8_CALMQ|nr:MupG family TIM beta-alpha barrel fold protein [Caldivirga maquilingensis]ABW02505.1 protein of unknown function DUF871 [Caldivirga maquilingensis IC-167]
MVKSIGISFAVGRRETVPRTMEIMRKASELGFTEVWSGVGLDSLDLVKDIAKLANELGYYYFVDINPRVLSDLGASPGDLSFFRKMGIKGVRADWGFNLEQLATMANNDLGIKVELNASVFPLDELDKLLKLVRKPENLMASHDWYPWEYTGLSLEDALAKSREFHNRGIPVGIFVSVKDGERTTVESLRHMDIENSASILLNSRYIDRVLIGDPLPSDEDLRKVANAKRRTRIRVITYYGLTEEEAKVFNREFHDVRIKEKTIGLTAGGENNIKPRNIVRRFKGAVTVVNDNPHYIQVWIFKDDAPPDPRFNVIGEVYPEDMPIVEHLAERTKGILSVPVNDDVPPVVLEQYKSA